jgi:hypothetical protein
MKARRAPLTVTPEHQVLLEEARAWLRTAARLERYAAQHGIPLPPVSLERHDYLPNALPFGARTVGPYASCALCVALLPFEGRTHSVFIGHDQRRRRVTVEVPEPVGTFLRYGETAICPRHARALVAEVTP